MISLKFSASPLLLLFFLGGQHELNENRATYDKRRSKQVIEVLSVDFAVDVAGCGCCSQQGADRHDTVDENITNR